MSQFSLKAVWALRDTSIQVVRFVNGQVVRADRGHCEATNPAHPASELNILTIIVLNLKMVNVISQYVSTDASITG